MRIFISYKRDTEPDVSVVRQVCNALKSRQHKVFIDREMIVGIPWAERIEKEICASDFLITFLSAYSVNSEMVRWEIEKAHDFNKAQGHPKILPVRVAYREEFKNPLGAWLNPINWALWDTPDDTARLIEELLQAAAPGGELNIGVGMQEQVITASEPPEITPPLPSAQPEPPGARKEKVNSELKFYIQRS